MKKSYKTSSIKRDTSSWLGKNASPARGARRLAFEAMERRLLLSATDLDMPALRQEAEPDSLTPPLVMAEAEMDMDEWPISLPMDIGCDDASRDESSKLEMDLMVAGSPPAHWDPTVGDRLSHEGVAPVPSRPMDVHPPQEGGYVDVGLLFNGGEAERDNAFVTERLTDDGQGSAKEFFGELTTVLPRRDFAVEIAIADGRSYGEAMFSDGRPYGEAMFSGSIMDDPSTAYGPIRYMDVDLSAMELTFNAGPEWILVEWHDPSAPPLEYSVIIRQAVESWNPETSDAFPGLSGRDFPLSNIRLSGEAVLERAMAGMRPPAHGQGIPFDPEVYADMELDVPDAKNADGREAMMVREGDVTRVRVVNDGYEADTFGAEAVFGSELTAEAAAAMPVLVAEYPALPPKLRATDAVAANKTTAPEDGGFIDVGLVMTDAVARTTGTAGDGIEDGGTLPEEIAVAASPANATGDFVVQGTLPEALLTMNPESGVLVESDLTAIEGIAQLIPNARGEAHDAVFEEMAEPAQTQTAGLSHFWAPAIFAVSALGRQAWKRKKRRDGSVGSPAGPHRNGAAPTAVSWMDEETDR